MKALKHFLLFPGLFLCLCSLCFSQQYTLRDQAEIAYQAQLTLNMYKDLLNVISYENLATESEIQELIRNSYSKSRTQLFYSDAAIIEDNIKPSNLLSGHVQDKTIQNYLHYFDLTYVKSDKETIEFFDFEPSNLKYGDYLYIKVKYTSLFKGSHKEDTTSYKAVDRLAEFRVEKKDDKWKTFITSIIYYQPSNAISSLKDDVKLDRSVKDKGTFAHLTEKLDQGNSKASRDKNLPEEFSEEKEKQDSLFNNYLETGKAALAADKLDKAFDAFAEAEKIDPSHPDLRRNLMELTKAQRLQISSVEKRFEQAKQHADKAYAARDFVKARRWYSEALSLNPEAEELHARIEDLSGIIQKIALLESNYAVGNYTEAIEGYTRAIKKDKNNPDYYYGRGKAFEKLNKLKEALKDYSMAIELDVNFMEALASRASLYTEMQQLHKAVADYTLMLSNPDYAGVVYPQRASVKRRMGDLDGAISDYNAAIEHAPGVADHHFQKGMILLSQEKREASISAFSKAIEKDDEHVRAFYQRGLAYAALENLQAASSDFEKARALGLDEARLAEINRLIIKFYTRAEGAMAENRYHDALESFSDALLLAPTFGRAWLRKGDAYFMLEDYDKAISQYDKAIAYDAVSFAYFKRGLAYQQKKEDQSASHDFKKFIPIGKELVAKTKTENGGKIPTAPLQLDFIVDRAEACYALGYAQLMTQQFVDALENLDMAIHARNFFPKAYFARGSALYALENYKGAVKDMEESIRMGLSEPSVFYSLGDAYVANDQLQDAIYSYSHTIELDPQYEAAYKGRAHCYKEFGEYALALEDIQTVLSLNESLAEDGELLTQKGLLELAQNKVREAKQTLDHALRLDKNNAWALYGKASALARERKMEESMELYRKAFLTGQIEWSAIKNDPLIEPISKQKAFKQLVKNHL